ncbi:MAG: Flp pilus assembly protein CpaB, partial [Lachnospiraceae bacterium]|nr:Flp pilus assembly protein CpaB [Lachnospiraceae bacterium]
SKSQTEVIVKVKTDIQAGTRIDESMIIETEVGSYGLPENTITDKADIIGKYSNCDIKKEDIIIASKLSEYAADERLDRILANGQKLITVTVSSIAAGVGNHLRAGDLVSVILYDDNAVETYAELKNIEIYSIENVEAVNIEDAKLEDSEDKLAATVTLVVNDAQAQKLVYSEYSGKLHIVFERRGAVV